MKLNIDPSNGTAPQVQLFMKEQRRLQEALQIVSAIAAHSESEPAENAAKALTEVVKEFCEVSDE